MEPTPLWLLPPNFNASENEGVEAYENDLPMRHRYGDSLAGQDWERGWKRAKARDKTK